MSNMKAYQVDYLGDIKASYNLIERIKAYYYNRGIPLAGAKFEIISEMDKWGIKFYSVRSNITWDVNTQTMVIDKNRKSVSEIND